MKNRTLQFASQFIGILYLLLSSSTLFAAPGDILLFQYASKSYRILLSHLTYIRVGIDCAQDDSIEMLC